MNYLPEFLNDGTKRYSEQPNRYVNTNTIKSEWFERIIGFERWLTLFLERVLKNMFFW